MRRVSAEIAALDAVRFVLLIGVVSGCIQGIPQLLLGGSASAGFRILPFLVIGGAAVVWWSAAFLLWWVAVHRRESAIWMTAAQIALGLVLGDLVHFLLGTIAAGIETHGQYTTTFLRDPWTFVESNLLLSFMRAPLWFVGAVVAVAMGRRLDGRNDRELAGRKPTHPEPTT